MNNTKFISQDMYSYQVVKPSQAKQRYSKLEPTFCFLTEVATVFSKFWAKATRFGSTNICKTHKTKVVL